MGTGIRLTTYDHFDVWRKKFWEPKRKTIGMVLLILIAVYAFKNDNYLLIAVYIIPYII
jgi:hypothetical protein